MIDYVLISKELLTELLDNTIECLNNNQWKEDSWDSDREVLTRYREQIKQTKALLDTSTQQEIKNFLYELAALIKKYEATFEYTNDDDGIHICIGETEVFVGLLDQNAAENLLKEGKIT